MKTVQFFIILIVIQAILCDKAVLKLRRKLIIPKMDDKCRKIKCSTVEDPQCIKLRRQDLKDTFYIIAINKCELEYIKCHDDVEAKTVPMKFCGHSKGVLAEDNKKNKTGTGHIRVKRYAKRSKSLKTGSDASTNAESNELVSTPHQRSIIKRHNADKNPRLHPKKHVQWKAKGLNLISKNKQLPKENSKVKRMHSMIHSHKRQGGDGYENDEDTEGNERKKIGKGIGGYLLDFQDDENQLLSVMKGLQYNENEDWSYVDDAYYLNAKPTMDEAPDFPMISAESSNNSKDAINEVDKIEYNENCPAVCPSRDVMVCAKCQHGIYKTFVSICHMRMFSCNHNDEVLQLISRYPCVLSAPYISEPDMKPKGRVVEAGDDDKILRFILCRESGKLGKQEDSRCDFHGAVNNMNPKGAAYVTFPDWFNVDEDPKDPRCIFEAKSQNLKFYDYKGILFTAEQHFIDGYEPSTY